MSRRRAAADRLWAGSGILISRWQQGSSAWVKDGKTGPDKALRLGFLAGGAAIGWLLVRSAPSLLWVVAGVWCWKAWKAAPAVKATVRGKAVEVPVRTAPEVPPEQFLMVLRKAIGSDRGVYLKTLAGALSKEYPEGSWSTAAVRSLCAAAGVPVKQVREPHSKPTVGVHRDDVPPLFSTPLQDPPVAVVVAGQESTTAPTTATTTPSTTPTETAIGGYRVVSVDDPDNPARTHVTVTKETANR